VTETIKRTFFLDENVYHHALNRVDRLNNPDDTALRLVENILDKCDIIMLPHRMMSFLSSVVDDLRHDRRIDMETNILIRKLTRCLYHPKADIHYEEQDSVVGGVDERCPSEDREIVQQIIMYKPQIFVSADEKLLFYLRQVSPALGTEALWPGDALKKYFERPTHD
jgi:hypothetical protein